MEQQAAPTGLGMYNPICIYKQVAPTEQININAIKCELRRSALFVEQ